MGTLIRSFLHGFIYKSNWYFENRELAYLVHGCPVLPKMSLPAMTSEGEEVAKSIRKRLYKALVIVLDRQFQLMAVKDFSAVRSLYVLLALW